MTQAIKQDHIIIFDTTLRDGEQSPGAAMTKEEKIRIARQLEKLGVNVIEAGFAAARFDGYSEGCDAGWNVFHFKQACNIGIKYPCINRFPINYSPQLILISLGELLHFLNTQIHFF